MVEIDRHGKPSSAALRATLDGVGLATLALVLAAPGCGVRKPPPAGEAPVSREGETRVRVLTHPDTGAGDVEDARVEIITPAYSSEQNALPEYPAAALAASCPDGAVAIRVTVSREGEASLLREVPGYPVPSDACHRAFWDATVAAVRPWRFAPAYRQIEREGPDADGDGRPDYLWWDQEPVAIYLDFEFSFRIVEGRGEVGSAERR